MLLALSARWALTTAGWLKRHTRAVQITGGVLLLAIGALLVTGLWGEVIAQPRGPIAGFSTLL